MPTEPQFDQLYDEPIPDVTAITTATGGYTLIALPGQYKIKFSSGCGRTGFADQWWDDATSQNKAKVINLGFTDIGGIDARLKGP